jgi:hypothetical protein
MSLILLSCIGDLKRKSDLRAKSRKFGIKSASPLILYYRKEGHECQGTLVRLGMVLWYYRFSTQGVVLHVYAAWCMKALNDMASMKRLRWEGNL